jgi:hypothetical protein
MSAKALLGATLFVLAAGLGGGGFYAAQTFGPAKIDPETLCPADGSKTITLVIVDKTDPLSLAEQTRAQEAVSKEREMLRRGDRIVVKLLEQGSETNPVSLDTIVDLCNPGAESNPFLENPKRVTARYEAAFREPIDAALSHFSGTASASASPIVRAIELAVQDLHAGPQTRLKLVIISDLMEHGAEISAYSGTLTEDALHKLMEKSSKPLFKGADIKVVLLGRPRYEKQQKIAVNAWRRFFLDVSNQEPAIAQP